MMLCSDTAYTLNPYSWFSFLGWGKEEDQVGEVMKVLKDVLYGIIYDLSMGV